MKGTDPEPHVESSLADLEPHQVSEDDISRRDASPVTEEAVGVRVRRRRTAPWIAGLVGVTLVGLVLLLASSPPTNELRDGSPLVGKPAPALVGKTIDGVPFDLASYRGRFVIVNFFASWCIPCKQEHPGLVSLSKHHAAAGDLQLVAVLFQDDPDDAREFFRRYGGDWPIVENRDAIAYYGVRGPPESFLLGRDGTVIYKRVGPFTEEGWDSLIAQAKALGG